MSRACASFFISEDNMDRAPITASGYVRMEAELKQLKSVDRPAVIVAIAEARAHGDLSENAEYSAAKEKQGFIEGRIKELEDKISRAEVIDVSALTEVKVVFGATVTLIDEDTEEKSTYQIVGEYEADMKRNQISITAPLARALIGKKMGDSIEVKTPKGEKSYEVVSIKYV
jgi:transcription elongation factor GreA